MQNIKGQISPITEVIEECKFHKRCDFVKDICCKVKPELREFDDRLVA